MEYLDGGVAEQLADKYTELEKETQNYCDYYNKEYEKLKGRVFKICLKGKHIANIFSQKPNFDTDYMALKIALENIKEFAKQFNLSICMPHKIGCGIANGDWNTVYKIIEEVFSDYDVTLYGLEEMK